MNNRVGFLAEKNATMSDSLSKLRKRDGELDAENRLLRSKVNASQALLLGPNPQ